MIQLMIKVNVNLNYKDLIFFFTSFDKESLLPTYSSMSTIENISKDIGKTNKFIIHIKKKSTDNNGKDSYYFNIKAKYDE